MEKVNRKNGISLTVEKKKWNISDSLPGILSNHQEVLMLELLKEIIFCNYERFYITQGCSLHSFKSSRGVGVEIVERDIIIGVQYTSIYI
jgi:hypothetical protein